MSKPFAMLAVVGIMSCSGSSPPPATSPPAPAAETEPIELNEPLAAEPEEPPPLAELIQACEGTTLDLDWWMRNTDQCSDGDVPNPPMPSSGWTARIEPETVRARSGTPVAIDYVLQNETDQPLDLWLDVCDVAAVAALGSDILDTEGKSVRRCGEGGGGCGGPHARLTLAPHGTAHLRFAEVETSAESLCLDQPLAAGEYQLIVRGHGGLPEARATLLIE